MEQNDRGAHYGCTCPIARKPGTCKNRARIESDEFVLYDQSEVPGTPFGGCDSIIIAPAVRAKIRETLGANAVAALLPAAIELIFVIAFAALIYSGDLASEVPRAIGFIILGNAGLCLVVALFSSNSRMITIELDAPGIMLGRTLDVLLSERLVRMSRRLNALGRTNSQQ